MPINTYIAKRTIPNHIQSSWERCQSKGLNPTSMDKKHIIGEYELSEYRDKYAQLLYYSSPILKDVFHSLKGTEFLLLIAIPEGYIIDAVGEPSFLKDMDNIGLRKGANWLEDFKGTNAIGTAIVEKQPVLVHGNQHFYHANQFLTCVATPIFHPDGQLLGILNLSAHQQNYHPYALELVKKTAQNIEQTLLLAHIKKHTKRITEDLNFIYSQHPSSLITINKEGLITRLNHTAARTIGCSEQSAIGESISTIITGLDPITLTQPHEKRISYKNQVFTTHVLVGDNPNQSCVILRGDAQNQLGGLTNHYEFSDIICDDASMWEAISFAKRAAPLNISLLISGESGTGKELFAQSIHGASLRNNKPFIALNCSAIPESLLESELFGYEKGAFTGAKNSGQVGKFEAADGGTLFLDEIGDMPLTAQATLLRVLQERSITRIGGITPRPIDVRIIAATHKNLQQEIAEGRFRADLFYRLNGFTIKLPSLRDRTDLVLLAEYILSRIPFKKEKTELTEDAKMFIKEYPWPGNFRQLHNVLQQATFMANQKPITRSLILSLCPLSSDTTCELEPTRMKEVKSLQEHEINLIKQVLEQTKGNISHAAKQLNIGRNTLYRKLKVYNIIS
jgi:sigma-54 dependent transcriptional regulator, acetoin dehydrogenase operon transcriptional activator AcoR